MKLPIHRILKKRSQVEMASLQDEVIDILYDVKPDAVLHGGTAIWRCYGGNRFSEDLDFYFLSDEKLKEKLSKNLGSRGLVLKKYKQTPNAVFSKISNNNTEVKLEVRQIEIRNSVARMYEKVDGTKITILTLTAEELLKEKIKAYENRKLIRDIYDVFYLSFYARLEENEKKEICKLLDKIEKPVDEKNLKTLIYSGAVPSFKQIMENLRRRFRGTR